MSINKSTKRGPFRILHSKSDRHPYALSQFLEDGLPHNGWLDVGTSPQLELATDGHQTFVSIVPKDEDDCWDIASGTLLAVRQNPMDLMKWDWWTFQIAGSGLPVANRVEWEVGTVEETLNA